MDAPGKVLLKIVSILFIIFGAIASVVSIIWLIGNARAPVKGGGMITVSVAVALILSIFELILGVVGIKRSEDLEHASFFMVSGVVLCVIAIVSMILSFQITSFIGFVLPILYIIGGALNKNIARQTPT